MQDFEFHIKIDNERVYRGKDGGLYIEGVASSTAVDSHETIFNANCQEGFAFDINNGFGTDEPVTIEVEHKGNEAPVMIIGVIERAFVDNDTRLNIVARLDDKNPLAVYYFEILSNPDPKKGRPKQLGLSINGYVKEAHWEYNEELSKQVRVFDRCVLQKVGIVRSPSNPETWVEKMARSFNWENTNKEQAMEDNQVVSQEQTTEVVEEVREEVKEETSTEAEVVETAPDAEVVEEVTEETTEEVTPEADKVEEVAETVVETPVEETPAPEAPEVETPVEETRTEEVKVDNVERVNMYSAMTVIESVEALSYAMQNLEFYVMDKEWEGDEAKQEMARNIVKNLSTSVPVLLSIIGMELAPIEKVEKTAEEVKTEEVETVEKSEAEVQVETKVEVKIDEAVVDGLLGAVRSLLEPIESKLTDLASKLETSEARNKELTERLERVEKTPASAPGAQLTGEEVIRGEESAYDQALKRAKEKKDADAVTSLFLSRLHLGK